MDKLRQIWQSYFDVGVQHQIWPDHIKKIVHTCENDTIRRFIHENILNMQNQLNHCNVKSLSLNSTCPSGLMLNLIDEPLKQFALSHHKYFFHKMDSSVSKLRDHVHYVQLLNTLNFNRFNVDKVINKLFYPIVNIRQDQLQILRELFRLEQHILCQFLPKTYSHIDYDMAPADLTIVAITRSTLSALTNDTKKRIQQEKRTLLRNDIKRYETIIQNYEYQFRQGLTELEQYFMNQTHNGIQILDVIKKYLTFTKEKTLRDINNNLATFRTTLVRRRRRIITQKQKINPSPEVMIDVSPIPFNNIQITHLSQGATYIRPNQS